MTSIDFVPDLYNIPATVSKIVVSGSARTDDSLLKKQFVDLVQSKNFNELCQNVRNAKERLVKLGVFKSVFSVIDVIDGPSNDQYKVIFKVEEKQPTSARVSVTHGSDGMTKLCGSLRVNNVLHGAESVDLDMEFGDKILTSTSATISKPLEANPNVRFRIGGSQGTWDHWWAKFIRHERSVFSETEVDGHSGLHRFQWDFGWREIDAKDLRTPLAVRRESGSSLKASLRHIFEHDTRSDMVFPDSGLLLRLTQEMASISPANITDESVTITTPNRSEDRSLQFRLEGVVQKPFRLTDWLVAEWTFSAGMLHSFTGHKVQLADRFFLGGPLELRGFKLRSVSPVEPLLEPVPSVGTGLGMDSDDHALHTSPIGTEAYWLTGGHLYTPLPYWGDMEDSLSSLFRLHSFCVAGSTVESPVSALSTCLNGSENLRRELKTAIFGKPRAVIGAGLVVRVAGVLRIEVNYCCPLLRQRGDDCKPGFQFGFGVYYM